LVSAQWAARGLTAQRDPLGHPAGLRALSDSFDPDAALDTASAHILNVRFKRHAACAGTHPTIEAILALVRDHDLRPDQVARATIRVDRRLDSVCNQQDVRSGLQAKFSLRMVAAMALSGIDTAAPASFSDMCVADPAIRTMFARMTVELGEDPRTSFSQVSLVLTDGRNLQAECDLTQSDTRAEMQAVRPKFSALVAPALGNDGAARLASAINQLDPLGDPTTILERARKPG
jgi:2-methylcitrate dehydratase PrpD